MRTTLEDRRRDFRIIYEELCKDFRISLKKLAASLDVTRNTARSRLYEALSKGYITVPQIRRRSFRNFKEYIFFVNCENPMKAYEQLKNDPNVVYHAVMGGFANLWVISRKASLDIEGEILFKGLRSDYLLAYALNHLWGRAIQNMVVMAEEFDPEEYKPKRIIETHWDESLEWWDEQFEILFRELKFNGRKKYTSIMSEYHISSSKVSQFLDSIHQACTVSTKYYPRGILAYDPYLFMLETDHEDFLVELFSQLPTSSFFFKSENRLFLYAHVEKASVRETGLDITDISQIKLLSLINNLKEKGYIRNESHAIFEYHWAKNL